MPRLIIFALFVVAAIGTIPAVAQTARGPGLFEQQRRQYREGVQQYPLLDKHHISDLLEMRVTQDGALALFTQVERDNEYQQRRAELEGFSEPAVVLCWQISRDLEQAQFELTVDDYTDPRTCGRLHIQARHMGSDGGLHTGLKAIELEKTWQSTGGFRRVYFSQVAGSVQLQVYANDTPASQPINLNLSEKDFATLRRNHHAETETWLRPVLRELKQEAAFAADPAIAWQVLAEDWPVESAPSDAVARQLPRLDDADFRVRLRASAALEKLGRDGALAMIRMDRNGLSLEQNLRLDEVISRFKLISDAEARRLGADPDFLLDCLYGQDLTARTLALERLSRLAKTPLPFDPKLPDEARIDAVNKIRQKFFPPPAKSKP